MLSIHKVPNADEVLKSGCAMVHFACQVLEMMAATKDFQAWAASIGRVRDQPDAPTLKTWTKQAGTAKAARKAATEYFAAALSSRAAKKPRTSAPGQKVNLRLLGRDAEEAE